MVTREDYPAGVPCWIDLASTDAEALATFYGGLFDWEFEDRMPPDSGRHYFIARRDGLVVGAIGTPDDPPSPSKGWNTYVAVEDADLSAKKVLAAGGRVLVEPVDVANAGRYAVCADPSGAIFSVWQARDRKGAQLVDAPGSWVFSDLSTPDRQGAEAFYAQVFGWETWSMDLGTEQWTLFCLPGYGEFLASIDPEIRQRHADDAIPDRFADAVGWMGDGEPGWNITFAIEGTDAMVERAVELGATVLTPAFDAGPTRQAVLADPQGTPFTISHYLP